MQPNTHNSRDHYTHLAKLQKRKWMIKTLTFVLVKLDYFVLRNGERNFSSFFLDYLPAINLWCLKKKSAEETIGKVLVKFCDRDEIKIKLT